MGQQCAVWSSLLLHPINPEGGVGTGPVHHQQGPKMSTNGPYPPYMYVCMLTSLLPLPYAP